MVLQVASHYSSRPRPSGRDQVEDDPSGAALPVILADWRRTLRMHLNQRKEKLSRTYISALCASVGCAIGDWDVDDDSVDVTLKKRRAGGVIPSPMLDIQLKATARRAVQDGGVTFPLKTKNFRDLRQPSHYPRILVVVTLPSDEPQDWLEQLDETRLSLMACGYWACLTDLALS